MTDRKRRHFPTSAETLIEEAQAARQEQQAAQIKAHVRAILSRLKSCASNASDKAA
jgi:ribosomal protein S19